MRIRTKFSLLASLIVLVTTAAISGSIYLVERRGIEERLAKNRAMEMNQFLEACRLALATRNEAFLVSYTRYLKALQGENDSLVYAYFVSTKGRIVADTFSQLVNRRIASVSMKAPPGVVEDVQPVLLRGRRIGSAIIGYSMSAQRFAVHRALDALFTRVILASVNVALIVTLIALFLGYLFLRPISLLIRSFAEVEKGNFEVKVVVNRKDELGELVGSFNQMVRRLAALDELKNEFIRSVSHDLRNPMAAIRMHLDYLLAQDGDKEKLLPQHRKILLTVMDAVMHLNVYVSNILDVAKMRANRMGYHLQPVDAASLIQGVCALYEAVARRRSIELIVQISPDLALVRADPERLEQCVINLVSNAMKFTRAGGRIVVAAKSIPGCVTITVADTGKGMSPEDLPNLFEPYYQADVADQRSRRIRGTGLGLYSVKQTVEAMGGTVLLESQLDVGTLVTLRLPAAPASVAAAGANA